MGWVERSAEEFRERLVFADEAAVHRPHSLATAEAESEDQTVRITARPVAIQDTAAINTLVPGVRLGVKQQQKKMECAA